MKAEELKDKAQHLEAKLAEAQNARAVLADQVTRFARERDKARRQRDLMLIELPGYGEPDAAPDKIRALRTENESLREEAERRGILEEPTTVIPTRIHNALLADRDRIQGHLEEARRDEDALEEAYDRMKADRDRYKRVLSLRTEEIRQGVAAMKEQHQTLVDTECDLLKAQRDRDSRYTLDEVREAIRAKSSHFMGWSAFTNLVCARLAALRKAPEEQEGEDATIV